MKVRELEEGLLDNVLARIQNMAGEDGITGFFRSLAGGNARLDLITDRISNEAERLLASGQTNIRQPGIELPMGKIIDAVFATASRLSQNNGEVTPIDKNGLFAHLKRHKADIIKGINAQAQEAGLAPKIIDAIEKHMARQPVEPMENLDFRRTVRATALVASVVLLDYEFRNLAGQDDGQANEIKFDQNAVQEFKQLGDEINTQLFVPGNRLQKLLRANENFKLNLESFIVDNIIDPAEKYLFATPEELQAAAGKALVDDNQMRAAFLGHLDPNDPNLTDEAAAAIDDIMTKQLRQINIFISKWFAFVLAERNQGNEKSQNAYQLLTDWGRNAISLVEKIKAPAVGKQTKQAAKAVAIEPDEEEELRKAEEAGRQAYASVSPEPAETKERRALDAYKAAVDRYFGTQA